MKLSAIKCALLASGVGMASICTAVRAEGPIDPSLLIDPPPIEKVSQRTREYVISRGALDAKNLGIKVQRHEKPVAADTYSDGLIVMWLVIHGVTFPVGATANVVSDGEAAPYEVLVVRNSAENFERIDAVMEYFFGTLTTQMNAVRRRLWLLENSKPLLRNRGEMSEGKGLSDHILSIYLGRYGRGSWWPDSPRARCYRVYGNEWKNLEQICRDHPKEPMVRELKLLEAAFQKALERDKVDLREELRQLQDLKQEIDRLKAIGEKSGEGDPPAP